MLVDSTDLPVHDVAVPGSVTMYTEVIGIHLVYEVRLFYGCIVVRIK